MYCGQCGTENNEEAGHCETCGAPLLISAGARNCSSCGASLGDHDRFCPTCGVSADDARSSETYDTSDSFEEIDIEEIDISQLPSWLQEMAPGEGQGPGGAGAGQPTPDDLPEWLRDTDSGANRGATSSRPPQKASSSPGVQHQPAEAFSLVSDDDLPEWLKALGDDEPIDESASSHSTSVTPSETSAVAVVFQVPPISRAWLTQGRRVDPSSAESAQQEFSPLNPVLAGIETTGESDIWSQTEQIDNASVREASAQQAETREAQTSGRRTLVRVVTLALLIVVVLMLTYWIIQGM